MPRDAPNRRTDKRRLPPSGIEAVVEFQQPGAAARSCRLIDLSFGDLAFELSAGKPGIESGASLANATVRVGEHSFVCHLSVLRVSRQFNSSLHCGAKLYPAGEADQNSLVALIGTLEEAGS